MFLFMTIRLEMSPVKSLSLSFGLNDLIAKPCCFPDSNNPITEPPPPPQQSCLEGYIPYQYGCYRVLHNTEKSWSDMRDECRSHSTYTIKSDLVSIHTSAEDATLHLKVMQSGRKAWIGLKETEVNVLQSTKW